MSLAGRSAAEIASALYSESGIECRVHVDRFAKPDPKPKRYSDVWGRRGSQPLGSHPSGWRTTMILREQSVDITPLLGPPAQRWRPEHRVAVNDFDTPDD
jgi:hypothetical protein